MNYPSVGGGEQAEKSAVTNNLDGGGRPGAIATDVFRAHADLYPLSLL
jgi:hypothetical protein